MLEDVSSTLAVLNEQHQDQAAQGAQLQANSQQKEKEVVGKSMPLITSSLGIKMSNRVSEQATRPQISTKRVDSFTREAWLTVGIPPK